VEVIDLGTQVQFKFTNNSVSSLTDVYFDDGTLLGIASISDSGAGVAFPSMLHRATCPRETMPRPHSRRLPASAPTPIRSQPNGVTQYEWMVITFNLINGKTYADTIAALALPNSGGTNDLRIGVHVQSYVGGYSESFINNPVPVPEAETYAMMLAGLGLVGFMGAVRKKSLQAAA